MGVYHLLLLVLLGCSFIYVKQYFSLYLCAFNDFISLYNKYSITHCQLITLPEIKKSTEHIQRIDFTKDGWYGEFLHFRENIAHSYLHRYHAIDLSVEQMLKNDTGFSVAYTTPSNAIITNTCIRRRRLLYFHEIAHNTIFDEIVKYEQKDCIYLIYKDRYRSRQRPLKDGIRNHTMYLTLRFEPNIYHSLEGLSSLIRLATHPEDFPSIKQVLINKLINYPPGSWEYTLEELIFSLFHESLKPRIIHTKSFCEKVLVLGGYWGPYGYGSFIPEPMVADMLRAVAYKYVDWHYKQPEDGKLSAFLLQRGGRRRIINSDEIFREMILRYNSSLHIDYFSLDNVTAKEQIRFYSSLDVAVHPHGAGSTNMIFMLPSSCILEIFPPKFFIDYYQKLSIGLEILYDYIISPGDLPDYCIKENHMKECPVERLRDREYATRIQVIVDKLDTMISSVRKKKYPLFWN